MYACLASESITDEERERLILEHLPQVRLIAWRILERLPDSVVLEDLISAGVIGLIAAVDNFDPGHNVKLRTYAEHKIRGAFLDSLRAMDWAPREQRRRAKQIEAAVAAVEQRFKRSSTAEEIAAQLDISIDEYHEWLVEIRGLNISSLECAAGDQGKDLLHYISSGLENLPSALLERAELQRMLEQATASIPHVEQTILRLYYDEELTLREIAQIVKLHESRVSQLKSQAILRLRTHIAGRWPSSRGVVKA